MQSSLGSKERLHVAIIMDGNGRWASAQGLPRSAGHRAGVDSLRRVCEAAPHLGIETLTVFAFSADNWRRPRAEVNTLMGLLRDYLQTETARLKENDIRLTVIGRRDRLPDGFSGDIAAAEAKTADCQRLHLRVALDYSARDAILYAVAALEPGADLTRDIFSGLVTGQRASQGRDVDLLVRTGGEKRLSDFLLWECAYAELHFTDRMWPDFDGDDLAMAVGEFHRRKRRFGTVTNVAGPVEPVPSAA